MIIISLWFLKKNLCFYQVARSPGMYCVKMLTIQVIISLEMKQLLMRFRHRTVQQTFILIWMKQYLIHQTMKACFLLSQFLTVLLQTKQLLLMLHQLKSLYVWSTTLKTKPCLYHHFRLFLSREQTFPKKSKTNLTLFSDFSDGQYFNSFIILETKSKCNFKESTSNMPISSFLCSMVSVQHWSCSSFKCSSSWVSYVVILCHRCLHAQQVIYCTKQLWFDIVSKNLPKFYNFQFQHSTRSNGSSKFFPLPQWQSCCKI